MNEFWKHPDLIPWYVFSAVWVISWLKVKPTKLAETAGSRLVTIGGMTAAFVLLFRETAWSSALRQRFLPEAEWIFWAGIWVTSAGVLIAIWARYCIGQYWSARVTLKEGHRLIRSGPYRFVRHPIYTGMLLGAAGRAFTIGEWRGVVAVLVILAAHSHKALQEEALLDKEFGAEYASYRRSTGFLFPRIWPAGIDTPGEGS